MSLVKKIKPAFYDLLSKIPKLTYLSEGIASWPGDGGVTHRVQLLSGAVRSNCCGISELNLVNFARFFDNYYRAQINEDQIKVLLAKYIKMSLFLANGQRGLDSRFIFIGIPTKVQEGSMYNMKFYLWVKDILEEWGFQQLVSPYKNINSNNTVTVLAAQYKPE